MAELLKSAYDLVDLKVSLDTSRKTANVHCALEATEQGLLRSVNDWQFPASDLGLPPQFGRRVHDWGDFHFPESVLRDLEVNLNELNYAFPTLWLHLARPYGTLGLVPWEQLLQPRLDIPIVRLPEFVSRPPLESSSSLDVVICTSVPVAKDPFEPLQLVRAIVDQTRLSVPRVTRFHLFTDKAVFDQFQLQPIPGVTSYSPDAAAKYTVLDQSTSVPDVTDRLESPWLQWIRDALNGRSVDAVHFVCHGYLASDRGAIALAESPVRNEDSRRARFIGSAEFITFLTQVGAWSAAFSGPAWNFSRAGLRLFADTLAQLSPVSVLCHDFGLDSSGAVLSNAYKLLFASQPAAPPASPAIFIYCQPFRVIGSRSPTFEVADETSPSSDLESAIQHIDNVPAWLASSQRYLDQCKWELRRLERTDPDLQSENLQMRRDGLREAIRQIQTAVGTLVRGGNL